MVVRFLIAGSLLAAGGCASFRSNPNEVRYETIKADPHRDSQAARELNTQAIEALTCGDFDDAMALANQALVSDVNYGPAHNTLGRIYFQQRKLYLAAWEFEHAGRLMPDRAEPINNQGLVYETATQLERASEFFTEALAIESQNPDIIANLARIRHKLGLNDVATQDLLKQTILTSDRCDVDDWAREKSATFRTDNFEDDDFATEPSMPTNPFGEGPAVTDGFIIPPSAVPRDPIDSDGVIFSDEAELPGLEGTPPELPDLP